MALGDSSVTSISVPLNQLIQDDGVTVSVSRTIPSQITSKSVFGTPQDYTPTTFTAGILIASVKGNELEVVMGGKPKETITFVCDPGTFLENDEITYNNLVYKVDAVSQFSLFGSDVCDEVQASREVKP